MPTTRTSTRPTATDLRTEATRYLYAGVGVADLAVEVVREYVAGAQTRAADAQRSFAEVKPAEVADQIATAVRAQVKALPAKVTSLLDENVSAAGGTYDDLARRGQDLVTRIRRQESTQQAAAAVETTVAKAKTTRTQATKAAAATRTATRKTADDTTAAVKQAAAKRTPATKAATTTARKKAATARSSAKATSTSARKAAADVVEAVTDAAQKVGD